MKFAERIAQTIDGGALAAIGVGTIQVNLTLRCNLACKHCHVHAGPGRPEMMSDGNVDAVMDALSSGEVHTLDLTGGAPEYHPRFREMVERARTLGKHVIVRSNLAVYHEPGMEDLPEFLAEQAVELVASLPYYLEENVDRVRGAGVFGKCIEAISRLNALGFGSGTGTRVLSLVYNPQGAFLSPAQEGLEQEYRRELSKRHGIVFDRLYTLTNMPIGRFRDFLDRTRQLEGYMEKLSCAFNSATLEGVMCRHLINVAWDGTLYDCDFNQVLGLGVAEGVPHTIAEFDHRALAARPIMVGEHCYGCTAGQGST
jgi:radical SAM/Cys-rich protein